MVACKKLRNGHRKVDADREGGSENDGNLPPKYSLRNLRMFPPTGISMLHTPAGPRCRTTHARDSRSSSCCDELMRCARAAAAYIQDRNEVRLVHRFPRLQINRADADPLGAGDHVPDLGDRPLLQAGLGFPGLCPCWIGKCAFARLGPVAFQVWCLRKDCEGLPVTLAEWIHIAMLDRMLHQLGSSYFGLLLCYSKRVL